MGALNDIQTELVQTLEAAGLTVTTDPRTLRPGVCLVEPPRVTGVSANLSEVEWDVAVTALPPGDATAVSILLDVVDVIVAAVPVTTANPGTYESGGQVLPAYTATVRYTIRRT